MVKDIFGKILYGFLFGTGMGLSILLIIYIYDNINKSDQSYVHKTYNENAGLVLTYENDRQVKDGVIVLGTIHNQGKDSWRNIKVEAEVFDNKGNFIDECTETVYLTLEPDARENFKITCGACSTNKIPDYEKVSVRIQDAYYVRK